MCEGQYKVSVTSEAYLSCATVLNDALAERKSLKNNKYSWSVLQFFIQLKRKSFLPLGVAKTHMSLV